jgi:AcrR family transcriptional regulator
MTSVDPRPSPGKRQRNKAEKERRIVNAARELFETQGFAETTTAQISDKAAVGTGTLYLYFESKEELLIEVFQNDVGRVWDDAFDRLDRTTSLPDQILQAFGDVSGYHLRDPDLARTYFKEITFVSSGGTNPGSDFMRKYYDRLSAVLLNAQEIGQLRTDVPVAVLSRNLFAIWSHLMRRTFTTEVEVAQVHEDLTAAFSVALLGLSPPTSNRAT